MRRHHRRHNPTGHLLVALLSLAASAPAAWASPPPEAWHLAVAGVDVPAAHAAPRGGVMTLDLTAVAAQVGLSVRRDGDDVTVQDRGGHTWTAKVGESFLRGSVSQVFLENALEVDGEAVIVPLDAIAALSGYFATLIPAEHRIELVAPTAPEATTFEFAKTDAELAKMARAGARDSAHGARAKKMRLVAPPDFDALRVRSSVSYIPGADGAFQLAGDGRVYGVDTHLSGLATVGPRGLLMPSGRLALDDQENGWSFAAGDLQSRIWGSARGVRASYRLADGWQPALTAYLPRRGSASSHVVVSWAEQLQLTERLRLEAELASDTALAAHLSYGDSGWTLGGSFVRRSSRTGMSHDANLYGSLRSTAGSSVAARLQATRLGEANATVRADLSLAAPLTARLRGTFHHNSAVAAGSWSHLEQLGLRLQTGAFTTRATYQLIARELPGAADGFALSHDLAAGVNLRVGSRFNLDVQLDADVAASGDFTTRGSATASLRPFRSTTLEMSASYPDNRLRVRLRQELPEGFALAAEIGGVTPYQGATGAPDPDLVRLTLSGTWDVDAPTRGATVGGVVRDRAGQPVAGAIVQLGRYRVVTEDNGGFAFSPLANGSYAIEVDPESLPAEFAASGSAQDIAIARSSEDHFIPLTVDRYASICGVIFQDLNGNAAYDGGEGLAAAPIKLGERTTAPGADGRFAFDSVLPGTHVVRVAAFYIAEGYEVVGASEVERVITGDGTSPEMVTFRVQKKEKPIIFTELPADGQGGSDGK